MPLGFCLGFSLGRLPPLQGVWGSALGTDYGILRCLLGTRRSQVAAEKWALLDAAGIFLREPLPHWKAHGLVPARKIQVPRPRQTEPMCLRDHSNQGRGNLGSPVNSRDLQSVRRLALAEHGIRATEYREYRI